MHEAQFQRTWFFFALFFVAGLVVEASVLPVSARCIHTVPISTTDRYAGQPVDLGETLCYSLDIPGPGVLIVSAATPAFAAAAPKLQLGDTSTDVGVLGWSPAGLVLKIHQRGAVNIEVTSQDPHRALGGHVMISRFAAAPGLVLAKDTEDPEPVPIQEPLSQPDFCSGKTSRDLSRFDALCRRELDDDHDDLFLCASPLPAHESVYGEISSDWTDDYDFFTFVLDEPRVVRLNARGDFDLVGSLHDSWGHRLGSADGSLSLIRTLAAGRYFVRVEGRLGAQGTYSLTLEVLAW